MKFFNIGSFVVLSFIFACPIAHAGKLSAAVADWARTQVKNNSSKSCSQLTQEAIIVHPELDNDSEAQVELHALLTSLLAQKPDSGQCQTKPNGLDEEEKISHSIIQVVSDLAKPEGLVVHHAHLHETRSIEAPLGHTYEQVLQSHVKEGWLSYKDQVAEEVMGEPVKAHAVKKFQGHFLPELDSGQIGYVDKNNHVRTYDSSDKALSHQLDSLQAKNVIVVPVAQDEKTGNYEICVHYHNEPAEAWGFKQEFYAYPGGRIAPGSTTINAMLNELYEESGFQIPEKMELLGHRYDPKIASVYAYVLVDKSKIKDIPKNSSLPEVAQFAPFDYSFVPAENKAKLRTKKVC